LQLSTAVTKLVTTKSSEVKNFIRNVHRSDAAETRLLLNDVRAMHC